jgi:DNA-binding MarR family transcriptional regulator
MTPPAAVPDRDACKAAAAACACFNLRKASRAVTQLFNAELQPSGLRSTQFVLLVVARAEEPVSLPRLARLLVMDRSTLSRNLQPLERRGLVDVTRADEGRGATVRLTKKGLKVLAETVPLWEAAQRRFVGGLGEERWGALLAVLSATVPSTVEG